MCGHNNYRVVESRTDLNTDTDRFVDVTIFECVDCGQRFGTVSTRANLVGGMR